MHSLTQNGHLEAGIDMHKLLSLLASSLAASLQAFTVVVRTANACTGSAEDCPIVPINRDPSAMQVPGHALVRQLLAGASAPTIHFNSTALDLNVVVDYLSVIESSLDFKITSLPLLLRFITIHCLDFKVIELCPISLPLSCPASLPVQLLQCPPHSFAATNPPPPARR
jgi:hypothetical protein